MEGPVFEVRPLPLDLDIAGAEKERKKVGFGHFPRERARSSGGGTVGDAVNG